MTQSTAPTITSERVKTAVRQAPGYRVEQEPIDRPGAWERVDERQDRAAADALARDMTDWHGRPTRVVDTTTGETVDTSYDYTNAAAIADELNRGTDRPSEEAHAMILARLVEADVFAELGIETDDEGRIVAQPEEEAAISKTHAIVEDFNDATIVLSVDAEAACQAELDWFAGAARRRGDTPRARRVVTVEEAGVVACPHCRTGFAKTSHVYCGTCAQEVNTDEAALAAYAAARERMATFEAAAKLGEGTGKEPSTTADPRLSTPWLISPSVYLHLRGIHEPYLGEISTMQVDRPQRETTADRRNALGQCPVCLWPVSPERISPTTGRCDVCNDDPYLHSVTIEGIEEARAELDDDDEDPRWGPHAIP